MTSKSLVVVYEKNHADKIPSIVEELKNEGKRVIILGLSSEVRERMDENNIDHKAPMDYLSKDHYRRIFQFGRKWLLDLPKISSFLKQAVTYKGLSLIEMDESRIYRGHYVEKIFEYISLLKEVIKLENPDEIIVMDSRSIPGKTVCAIARTYNIPYKTIGYSIHGYLNYFYWGMMPHAIKHFRRLRESQRSIFYKISTPKISKNKKILFLTYDVNQVKAIRPVIEEITKAGKYESVVVRSDAIVSDRTKKILESYKIPFKTFEGYIDSEVNRKTSDAAKKIKENWNLLRKSNIKENLKIDDVPVWDVFLDIFKSLFTTREHLHDLVKEYETILRMLNLEKPDLVIVLGEVSSLRRILVRICKQKKIPTLFLQHGVFGEDTIFDMAISDYMAVQGKFTKNLLAKKVSNPKRILITGQPRYDNLVKRHFDRSKVFSSFGLDPNKKLVLLTTQPFRFWGGEGKEALVRGVLIAMKKNPDKQLLIKLHPMEEKESNFYGKLVDEIGTKAIIATDSGVLKMKLDIFDLIEAADIMVTGFSTTVIEAIILDKPVISINLTHKPDMMPYAEEGGALGIYNLEKIAPAIKSVLENKNVKSKLARSRKKFIEYHMYKIDGNATERVVNLIENILNK